MRNSASGNSLSYPWTGQITSKIQMLYLPVSRGEMSMEPGSSILVWSMLILHQKGPTQPIRTVTPMRSQWEFTIEITSDCAGPLVVSNLKAATERCTMEKLNSNREKQQQVLAIWVPWPLFLSTGAVWMQKCTWFHCSWWQIFHDFPPCFGAMVRAIEFP